MKQDVIIVGGGMVGATLAIALSHLPLKIALIDANAAPANDDPRLIALNAGSVNLLKNLELFAPLSAHAAPIQTVHVSQRGRFGSVRIHARELNLSQLGAVIPAKYINQVLEKKLAKTTIQLIRPAKVTELTGTQLTLQTSSGKKTMEGKLIIAADGSDSTIRTLLDIPTKQQDYQQSAIVTMVDLSRPHQQVAHERFVADGAIAMLPLMNNQSAMIWTAPQEKINTLTALNDEAFLSALQTEFGFKLGRFKSIHQRFIFPLRLIQAEKRVHGRTLLMGNALHTLHPLAAQGFNLALYEVAAITEWLTETPFEQLDLATMADTALVNTFNQHLSHYLNAFFTIDFLPVNLARQIGMVSMGIFGILKRRLAAYPAGCAGRLPMLLIPKEM